MRNLEKREVRSHSPKIKCVLHVRNIGEQLSINAKQYFGFALTSVLWPKRVSKFESSFECFCVFAVIVLI